MTGENEPRRSWPRSLLIWVTVSAGLFFCFGQWASDALFNYGFELFGEATPAQDAALIVAAAIASPSIFIFENDPFSRACFALNGTLWGCVAYGAAQAIARLRERRRSRRL